MHIEHRRNEEQRLREERLKDAALYVTEGEKNDVFYNHPEDKDGVLAFNIVHHPVFYMAHLISSVLLMLLALIEKPSVFAIEEEDASVIHVPLELSLLLIPMVDLILRACWLRSKFFTHRTFLIAFVLFIMFVEALAVIIRAESHLRISRAIRPLFFIDSYVMSETRRTFRNIVMCIREIIDVLLVLLLMVAFFALIGYYLFTQMDPDYFSTVGQSYISLFITLTTSNHPDVMLETYHSTGWSALFFIIFLVITLYLLTSVLLGVVYSSFSHANKRKFKKKFKHQRLALEKAYEKLTENDGVVDVGTFLMFMLEYKPLMSECKALCTFKALQDIKNRRSKSDSPIVDQLALEDFYNLYDALEFKWVPLSPEENQLPWYFKISKLAKTLVVTRFFNIALSMVVIANTVFLIIYTALAVPNGEPCYGVLRRVLAVSFVFIAIYCIEAILKVIAFGYKYFTKFQNLVDFAIIVTSLIMLCLEINPKYYILLSFRPVKLIRLLWLKKRYSKLIKALLFLKRKLISGIVLLLVIYYSFAIIGMESFHTTVRRKCCDYNHTWYGVGDYYSGADPSNAYWLLNFDNILKSFTTLFALMVVNNWYIVMEGFAAEVRQQTSASHHAWLTRLYFISFYIVTLVVLQVTVTFIVDAFVTTRKEQKREYKMKTKNGIVEAFYGDLSVTISEAELKAIPKQDPSTAWWQWITHHIRKWRTPSFASCQHENGGYTCKGKRKKEKHYLDLQLYKDKLEKWEEKKEEGKDTLHERTVKFFKKLFEYIFE